MSKPAAPTVKSVGGSCYATALRKASRRVSQFYDVALEPSGIKTTQFAILSAVERSGPVTVGALAHTLVMDAGGLAHTLKPLIRDGMLSIDVDPSDKRSRLVSIETSGSARVRDARVFFEVAQERFEQAFGHAEAHALRAAVRIIASDAFLKALDTPPRELAP
ncbi:MAG: MarR family winged helix-turn-helix transcriptional regulator [Cypionkella sp.]